MYDINGMNLYVYCDNNPVMDRDDGAIRGSYVTFRLNFGVKTAHFRE